MIYFKCQNTRYMLLRSGFELTLPSLDPETWEVEETVSSSEGSRVNDTFRREPEILLTSSSCILHIYSKEVEDLYIL